LDRLFKSWRWRSTRSDTPIYRVANQTGQGLDTRILISTKSPCHGSKLLDQLDQLDVRIQHLKCFGSSLIYDIDNHEAVIGDVTMFSCSSRGDPEFDHRSFYQPISIPTTIWYLKSQKYTFSYQPFLLCSPNNLEFRQRFPHIYLTFHMLFSDCSRKAFFSLLLNLLPPAMAHIKQKPLDPYYAPTSLYHFMESH
jgi:hypothetical protein